MSCFIIATKTLRSFFTKTPFAFAVLLHRETPFAPRSIFIFTETPFTRKARKEAKPRVHPCPHCLTNFQSPSKRQSTY
jgi:hypothetical protein